MEKNAIKKFAVWAREDLIKRVSAKAEEYGVSKDKPADPNAESVSGRLLNDTEKKQRRALIEKVGKDGYEQVIEEVAYTWFNRFIALRFMEANNYLPSHVRVFTDENNAFEPQILTEALHIELDGLSRDKVISFKQDNKTDELYKYLIITQCNALNSVLPKMFQRINDYTELLFPDNIRREGSVLEQMITLILEEDWKDQVQIIGWLYQYYNSALKDRVFDDLKKNIKISKKDIPAATQLFTPDWIVRYMVENSLGRTVINALTYGSHSDDDIAKAENLRSNWKYYLDEAPQNEDVTAELCKIEKDRYSSGKSFVDTTFLDPCMGSGHILVYAFDVYMDIYRAQGWSDRDAARRIVEKNLFGLDIDERAAQLAYFAVMMRARKYDSRFFSRGIQPNIYTIAESNKIDQHALEAFINGDDKIKKDIDTVITDLHDAKEYGSIVNATAVDFERLNARVLDMENELTLFADTVKTEIKPLIDVARVLAQKYDVVVTNPPYMGGGGMGEKLSDYVKKNYPDSKSDLFAVFMERCGNMTKKNGYQAMITQHAWMFLSSFEKLRGKLLLKDTVNMAHLGARAFDEIGGEVVQTTAFVFKNSHVADYKGTYCRLIEPTSEKGKEDMFLTGEKRYVAQQENFVKIPGAPVAYWVSNKSFQVFDKTKNFESYATTRAGMITGNNNVFIRLWFEIENTKIGLKNKTREEAIESKKKWFPYNKGGEYRKWYGNNEYVVNWENDGFYMRNYKDNTGKIPAHAFNLDYIFKENVTWNALSSYKYSARYTDFGFLFDASGSFADVNSKDIKYILAYLCSVIATYYLSVMNPTLNFQKGNISALPLLFEEKKRESIDALVSENISLSRSDWDSYETSWDFKRHPLLDYMVEDEREVAIVNYGEDGEFLDTDTEIYLSIENAYLSWKAECNARFDQLKANEEELNRIFIDIYGLQDELTPEVADKDVTVHRIYDTKDEIPESMKGSSYAHTKKDEIKSLISYAVGCMFGRYSLDIEGLVFAGGNFDAKYCRWIKQFGDEADKYIDEDGQLIEGCWAGCTLWKYDGIRIDGKWVPTSFAPNTNNVIPIYDDEYLNDDIVGYFIRFIKTVYGEDTLEENLKFIADALEGKGTPREVIRNYFLNEFYADHCKMYQKRPIYWLFDSGKKNGFKALIYMHRYRTDTIARLRTDYIFEQQGRYKTAIEELERRISAASTAEKVKLNKQLTKLKDQGAELRVYEEKIHHLADQMIEIDLDDGVKHNYELFKDVLAKIK